VEQFSNLLEQALDRWLNEDRKRLVVRARD
jgi:hypothetical protein